MKLLKYLRYAFVLVSACLGAGVPSALGNGLEVITAATGGEAISADTAGGAWTMLTGPVITETKARDTGGPGLGTIILNVPSGFEFNPDAPVQVLLVAAGRKTINRMPDGSFLPVEVTPTTITLTITAVSRGGAAWPDKLIFQNIQVRPTAGYPLAVGDITESGTCEFRNLTLTTGTWGSLREVGGTFAGYVISGGDSATAGTPITVNIQRVDQFGNPLPGGTTETLIFSGPGTIGNNLPTVNGSTDAFVDGIPVTFDENGSATVTVVDYKAETVTLQVSGGKGSSGDVAGGLVVAVAPGPATTLVFSTPPVEVPYGSDFDLVVQTIDQYGNPSSSGLPANLEVTLGVTSGTGALVGTVTQDIGTAAGNGAVTFNDLQINSAGSSTVSANAEGLTVGSTVVNVSQVVLTPIVTVAGKIYDGSTAATINSRKLEGIVGTDDVSLGTSGTAVFENDQVGTAKTVLVNGLALSGKHAGNYRLATTSLSATADITPRPLTITATADNKAYDGTTAATVILSDDRVAGDSLTVSYSSAVFSDPAAGDSKTVTVSGISVSGPDAANYSCGTSITTATTAQVTKAALTVTADNKTRAVGMQNPVLTGTLAGVQAGDNITASYATDAQADSPVGTYAIVPALQDPEGKLPNYNVTINNGILTVVASTPAGYVITGSDSGTAGTPVTITIQIVDEFGNPVPGGGTETLVFDGAGTIGTNAPTVNGSTDAFTNGIPVTFDSNGTAMVTLVEYRAETNTVEVTDGTISSTNANGGLTIVIAPDTASSLVFATPSVEVPYGSAFDLGVQTIDQYGNPSSSGLPANLEVTLGVTSGTGALVGTVTQDIGTAAGNGTVSFNDLQINSAGSSTVSASAEALTVGSTVVNVSQVVLTPIVTVAGKIYDGTTTATISSRKLEGIVGTDDVSLGTSGTAVFENDQVGTAKVVLVSGLVLGGKDAGNYRLATNFLSATADITPRPLTIIATADNKAYDGTTAATVTLSDDRVAGDSLTVSYTSAVFSDPAAGDSKTVTVSGISLSGPDAANYSYGTSITTSTTAQVTKAALTVTADNKTRAVGMQNPVLTGTLTGVQVGDDITVGYSTDAQADSLVGTYAIVPALQDPEGKLPNYNVTISNGVLTVTASAPAGYIITGSDSGTAGTPVTITIQIVDEFGNPVPGGGTETLVFDGAGAIGTNAPTVNGSTDAFTNGIPVTFDSNGTATVTLVDYRAETNTVEVTDGTISSTNANGGLTIVIAPDTASSLVFATPSVEVPYGTAFDLVVQTTDQYGNPSSSGLPTNLEVTLGVTSGTGALVGTVTQDIGTAAGNGTVTFNDLQIDSAGNSMVTAGAEGLTVGSTVVNVSQVVLTPIVTVAGKIYDGSTAATINSRKLEGIVGTDDVSLGTSGTAVFENDQVGTAKTVLVNSLALSGKDAGNYRLATTSLSISADITPRPLTITATVDNKAYDGTTAATVTLSDDRVAGDSLTVSYTSAVFSDPAVGDGKTVTVSGINISGPDAANYSYGTTITTAATAQVTKAALTVTADNKARVAGTENPVLTGTLTGVQAGDHITAIYSTDAEVHSPAGTYAIVPALQDPDGKLPNYAVTINNGFLTVTASTPAGYVITGSDSGTAGTPVTITIQIVDEFGNPVPGGSTETLAFDGAGTIGTNAPTVNGSTDAFTNGIPVTFDTNGTATVTLVDYRAETNTVQVTDGTISSTNANGGLTIVIAPDTASSLMFTTPSVEVAYGSAFDLEVQSIDQYGNPSSSGLPANLEVTLGVTSGTGALVGTVTQDIGTGGGNGTVTFNDLQIDSAGSSTVTASAEGLTVGTTVVNVSQVVLTPIVTVAGKIYDGTTAATINSRKLEGIVGTDDVSLGTSGTAAFESDEASTAKTVLVSGLALSGKDAGNYWLATASLSTTVDIGKAPLVVAADNKIKVYGAPDPMFTATISGFVSGDTAANSLAGSPSLTVSVSKSSPVGSHAIVAGLGSLQSINYSFAFQSGTLTVTPATLVVTADSQTKIFGAPNPVLSGNLSGVVEGDNITASFISGAQTDSPVGRYNIVPILSDPDHKLANYRVTANAGSLNIIKANVTMALTSSENPSLQGSNVTLTVTVAPVAPATATPTGTVLFLTNGVAYGEVPLSSGLAILATDRLPLWNTVVTAQYSGDPNFTPSMAELTQLVRPPLGRPWVVSIVENHDGTVTVTCWGTPAVEHYTEATSTPEVAESWVRVSTNVAGIWDGFWTYTEQKMPNSNRFYRAVKPY